MNQIAPMSQVDDTTLAQVILNGDLSRLSPADKVTYYNRVCESVGLNPFTKPFDYLKLSGKEVLYATRNCGDQLRQIHGVNLEITDKRIEEGLFIVTVRAVNKLGRRDEDMGVVQIDGLRGEAKANAMLKAITKAKRRATLSICGLGWLDETEAADIPGAQFVGATVEAEPEREAKQIHHDPATGDLPMPPKPRRTPLEMFAARIAGLATMGDCVKLLDHGTKARAALDAMPPGEQDEVRRMLRERADAISGAEATADEGPDDDDVYVPGAERAAG